MVEPAVQSLIGPQASPSDEPKLTPAEAFVLRHRAAVSIIVHVVLFAVALLVAYGIRFEGSSRSEELPWFHLYIHWLPVFMVIKLLVFGKMKLFHSNWRYSSIRDIVNILLGSWIALAILFIFALLFFYLPTYFGREPLFYYKEGPVKYYQTSILLLDFLATVFLVATARLAFRLYREELRPVAAEGLRRVLIIGAGNAAEAIIREINRMRVERYRVIGMVDDDPRKSSLTLHGVGVLGTTEDIREICEQRKIDEILIAIPSATRKQLSKVIEYCSGTKLTFKTLPGLQDLIDGRVATSQMRPVDINDLLGRDVVRLDDAAVANYLRGRRLLITGAGGSIGSEMCRQVCRYQPASLILLEQAENPLFDIENELAEKFPTIPLTPVICDVYDRQNVMAVWNRFRPEVVIHAAAHKHVPLMERNPWEAIKNNVLGTRNVADASVESGVKEFVLISTDKAVNPSSVMGVTKRVAEIYTQSLNNRPLCKTQFKAVRFGNVLGSAGSVVPTFRKQIAAGGPVRVTHPEMTRYFMTIPEASQLVLQAAATGTGGQIYLLDMGEPVKIVDLARQMITLSGFRPGEDIDIVFSGVRPGEKMFEELRTTGEDVETTCHPKISIWRCRSAQWEAAQAAVERLALLQHNHQRQPIIDALRQIVPEYTPLNPPASEKNEQSPPASEPL
ncbi:MAG: nucleoside-diphosphate sugar epimerase/dehydratase [Planctomycetaceae bacterium]|nr:polysaccharide biosynthesis protein [Planctomycetaceae bacterium]